MPQMLYDIDTRNSEILESMIWLSCLITDYSSDSEYFYHVSIGKCLPDEYCQYPIFNKIYAILTPFGYGTFRLLLKFTIFFAPALILYLLYRNDVMALLWMISPIALTFAFSNVMAQFLAMVFFLLIYKTHRWWIATLAIPLAMLMQHYAIVLFVPNLIFRYIHIRPSKLISGTIVSVCFIYFVLTLYSGIPRSSYTQTSMFSLAVFTFPLLLAFLAYVEDTTIRMMVFCCLAGCIIVSFATTFAPLELGHWLTDEFFFPRLIETFEFLLFAGLAAATGRRVEKIEGQRLAALGEAVICADTLGAAEEARDG